MPGKRLPTTGPAISFRLPIASHADLAARAEAYGESPGEYVRRVMLKALAQQAVIDERRAEGRELPPPAMPSREALRRAPHREPK